jgi:hypothetical protein
VQRCVTRPGDCTESLEAPTLAHMSETWLSRCERYVEARTSGNESRWRELEADLQRDFAHGQLSESDVDWLTGALTDSDAALREEMKWFVEFVLRVTPPLVAAPLFDPLIRAAVYERDPSYNRYFVEPCVRSTGWQPTAQALLVYVRDGTDSEKAGAVNALYHVFGYASSPDLYLKDRVPDPTESEGESPSATWHRAQRIFLEEFVRNPDVDVRRSIVPHLHDVSRYHSELQDLAQEARRIALSHTDEYIQARAEITWGDHHGEKVQFPALPHRSPPADE